MIKILLIFGFLIISAATFAHKATTPITNHQLVFLSPLDYCSITVVKAGSNVPRTFTSPGSCDKALAAVRAYLNSFSYESQPQMLPEIQPPTATKMPLAAPEP